MQNAARATGKDIILDLVENMRTYREELVYSTVVPTSFDVYLHPDDYGRLEGIFPAITAEARRALDEELGKLNRRLAPAWLQKVVAAPARVTPAHDGWNIAFYRDENDELQPGDVLIDSRMMLPPSPEFASGTRTRRITTARIGEQVQTTSQVVTAAAPAAASDATVRTAPQVFATLTYEDKAGRHSHPFTGSQLVIGRGGAGYWVDVRVEASPDISREHVRLRRDAATGQFFLKDVSLYGTSINGQRVASSVDTSDGAKKDLNVEVPLPSVARIGLADMVYVDFRAAEGS
jgi:hypothetical protein